MARYGVDFELVVVVEAGQRSTLLQGPHTPMFAVDLTMRESVVLAPLALAGPKHKGSVVHVEVEVEVALGQQSSVGRRDQHNRQGPRRVPEPRGAQNRAVVVLDVEGVPVPNEAGDDEHHNGVAVVLLDVVAAPHGVVVALHGVVLDA